MIAWRRILTVLKLAAVVLGVLASGNHGLAEQRTSAELRDRLMADLDDGSLDEFPLFDAALIASGVHSEEGLDYYDQQFSQLCEILPVDKQASPRQRAKDLFCFLHKWILTGSYSTDCTELDRALDDGQYNCVSATILFHCLCAKAGLQPQAMATAEHVYSRYAEGSDCDVETTFPQWFSQPASARALLRTSRSASSGPPRRIGTVPLLGKIYYNIGVSQLEAHRFAAAVDALRISVRLDPQDGSARENLLAALNNWALWESDAGRFEHAAELLALVAQREPNYGPFLANDLHIHQKWALSLCQSGKHREAFDMLERCYTRRSEAELYDLGRFAVFSLWAESLLDQGQVDLAWNVFAEARQRFPKRAELLRYEETAIHRSVEALLQQGKREEAIDLSAKGVHWQPSSQRLKRQQNDLTRARS
ncbi:MAG: hypothetical protein ACC628_02200 [Pirellulaceae bacterium]